MPSRTSRSTEAPVSSRGSTIRQAPPPRVDRRLGRPRPGPGRGDAARIAVEHAARRLGEELGRGVEAESVERLLELRGYEPFEDDGTIRFRNCPFHALTETHRQQVCSMNLALVEGLLDGGGANELSAALEPGRAGCCVAVCQA